MILNSNPTRMELLRLKKKLGMARRGHKLLKDKQDELMRKLLEVMEEFRHRRKTVSKEYFELLGLEAVARGLDPFRIPAAPAGTVELTALKKNIMSVIVPEIQIKPSPSVVAQYRSLGGVQLSLRFAKFVPELVRLVSLQRMMELIASELEKTRRRVNALEYVMIPGIVDTIRYINLKLSETERGNTIRLLKVKDMLLAKQARGVF